MHINLKTTEVKRLTRTETLGHYYNDIPKYKELTIEEQKQLFKEYRLETNKKAKELLRKKIIEHNLLFVISVAKRYATNETIMDIIEEGNIGLMEAVEEYNPDLENSASFTTFAINYIVRKINEYKTGKEMLVKAKNYSKTFHIKAKAKEALFKELGREPSLDEIMGYINDYSDRYKIKDSSDLIDTKMSYIDDTTTNMSGNQVATGEINEFNSHTASLNLCELNSEHEHQKFIVGSLLKDLKPLERTVLEYSFAIGHYREYTHEEIAQKVGYTKERIRQIKHSALEKVKEIYIKKYNRF